MAKQLGLRSTHVTPSEPSDPYASVNIQLLRDSIRWADNPSEALETEDIDFNLILQSINVLPDDDYDEPPRQRQWVDGSHCVRFIDSHTHEVSECSPLVGIWKKTEYVHFFSLWVSLWCHDRGWVISLPMSKKK